MLKTILVVIALIVCLISVSYVTAGEVYISPPVTVFIPAPYPTNVKSMTQQEFYVWATQRNKQAEQEWHQKASNPFYNSLGTLTRSNTNGSNTGAYVTPYGATIQPGQSYEKTTVESFDYQNRFVNPDYIAPGPLTIINPFVKPK